MGEAAPGIICLVIILIGFGLASIFARDFMWELTHWSNQVEGKASERTGTWDAWQIMGGGISLLVGIGLACFAISAVTQENTQNGDRTATAVQASDANRTLATQLDGEFGGIINELIETATAETQRIRAVDRNIPVGSTTVLDFGLCSGEDFYVFVGNYRGQREAYGYVANSTSRYCRPAGWTATEEVLMGNSRVGGAWYTFDYANVPERLPADQAATYLAMPSAIPLPTATRHPRPTDGR